MKLQTKVLDELRVEPGKSASLDKRSTSETRAEWLDAKEAGSTEKGESPKVNAESLLEVFQKELESAQEMLYATNTHALLIVFQAPDAAGKDGTIKHVLSGVNPQGCDVTSFKAPTAEELAHDFLWRCSRKLPEKGRIGVFNRSYYEEVLVVRVHPELLDAEQLPTGQEHGGRLWKDRFEEINAFEDHLTRSGTRIVKFFLHVSADEQKARLLERLDDPSKNWKFSSSDLAERAYFDDYQRAYEAAITATSTPWAPWYVIPADLKYAMRALVAGVLAHTFQELDLRMPEVTPERSAEIESYKKALSAE
jgi:PPK2 family polyphosphate:nucleotide phosphotransferase